LLCLVFVTTLAGFGFCNSARGGEAEIRRARFVARLQELFEAAQKRHLAAPTNAEAAWEFARACFDRAEYPTNDTERAVLAEQGIATCRQLLKRQIGTAPVHYYLAMNLGQLARTRKLSALRIVDEMEREFKAARQLDEQLDFAGPDRNLGLLYFEAPAFASVGSRSKARQHFHRAAELAPDFPENRLNLVEAYLKWSDNKGAAHELKALEKLWPMARTNFTGEAWAESWPDWETRLKRTRKTLEDRAK
jgi:tetratricopeptide (TPR) repeat protein